MDEVHPPCSWLTAGCSGSACTRDRVSESERDRQTDGGTGGAGGMAGEKKRQREREESVEPLQQGLPSSMASTLIHPVLTWTSSFAHF